ncbi:MAG: transcription-repair coupling factor [Gammaproteobacteria bacterium]|nr:transcription-repair coupling factor [Gammaproteobacteria bacterium]
MKPLALPPLPVDAGDRRFWGQLPGSSLSLAVAQAAQAHDGLVLVATPDMPTAIRLEQEIALFLGESALPVMGFPDWEMLPYDSFSPHQDIVSARLLALYRLPQLKRGVLVVPVSTLLQRLAPRRYVAGSTLLLAKGDRLDPVAFRERLTAAGYRSVGQVMEHGEFALRGSLLDLFPMGSTTPYRIDFFDDEVDSIRVFDVDSQRSGDSLERIDLLPAREFPLTEESIARFRAAWRSRFETSVHKNGIYQLVSQGGAPAGIEFYLPMFFEATETLFDYLPAKTLALSLGPLDQAVERYWTEVDERYESLRHDRERPLLPPEELFLRSETLFTALKRFPRIQAEHERIESGAGRHAFPVAAPPEMVINPKADSPLAAVHGFLAGFQGRALFCAESAGRRESLLDLLGRNGIQPKVYETLAEFLGDQAALGITVAPIEDGFLLTEKRLAFIAEKQLFGNRVMQSRRRRGAKATDPDALIRSLAELKPGDPIVHIDHGVGRYQGLTVIDEAEFLLLAYGGGDKLYVPVHALHLVARYSGLDAEAAPINKLGTEAWSKARRKAAEKARDVAAELLDIHARRAAKPGFAFDCPETDYARFAAAFPFEETADQERAIAAVVADMRAKTAMDRLVCGDVGFGKTEVAMRAAFIAVQSGRQVAVLVPTTLLAQQHYENFKDRFADWPVRIESLSRFKTAKETGAVVAALAEGRVDIVIGTHKLLQEGVKFKNLGLTIIDEEHRFGVRQKEALKALRSEVDILTLTATPIPRTLNMSLSGMREISIIATPPAKRLAIKTFVREYQKPVIREAVLRETMRGGQVYYLHNDIESIEQRARELAELVPEARIAIGHGQMRERELESVMSDFYHQRFNVLVCTTIIETGIDVPSANTIIMERADKLGLAQLHQLRGRVGRSHHQAYAYLLTPPPKLLSTDAQKRLEAIESLEDLGAGFTLATHDMEIRGAGELLGEDQSGQIESIGFALYMEMLENAVKALKSGKEPSLDALLRNQTEVDLRIPALLPETYVQDVNLRLSLYKRIASAASEEELRELQVEMIDRFGLLPDAAKQLFALTAIKLKAAALGVLKLDAGPAGGRLEFAKDAPVDPISIIRLIQKSPTMYKLDGPERLKFLRKTETPAERLTLVGSLLDLIQPAA